MSALRCCCIGLVLLVLSSTSLARISIAVLPLNNADSIALNDYVGSSIAERLYHVGALNEQLHVWDPCFLTPLDTLLTRLDSDSALLAHQYLWKWNLAVGGQFWVRGDTVSIQLTVVKADGANVLRTTLLRRDTSLGALCDTLIGMVVSQGAGESVAAALHRPPLHGEGAGYRTYLAGYRYECFGNFAAAISAYRYAIEQKPLCVMAQLRLAALSAQRREPTEALELLQKAHTQAPQNPFIASVLLQQLVDAGYRQQGQDFMERNRELLERTANGQTAIGMLYMVQGEYQRAIAQLSRALALGAPTLKTEFALGQANLTLGRFERAADIFNRLVTFRPGYLPYYTFLGDAYRSSGRLMEALRVLEAAYRLNGASIPLIMNLARVYFDIGWLEKSRQLLLQAHDLNPELSEIDINLGVVSLHMGDLEQATKLFESVAQRQVNPQSAYNNQANIAQLQGDTRKAIKLYRMAEKSGDKNETVLFNLAQAYVRNNKYAEAMLWFDELLRIAPERIDVLLLQASIILQQGDVAGTELLYRKMLDLAPQDERVVKGLVAVLQTQHKYKDAADVVEFYLVNFPNDMEFRFLGAELYRKMEWFEVALQHAEFLVRDFPDHYYGYLGSGSTLFDMIHKGKSKDVDKAIEQLQAAAQRMPNNAQLDWYLGLLYLDYKAQPELAREHLSRALAGANTEAFKQQVRLALKRVKK